MARARVAVRDAVPDDAVELCALWADLLAGAGAGAVGRGAEAPSEHGVRRRLADVATAPHRRVLVACVDERIVGAAVCSVEPLSPLHEESAVRVSYLYVLPGHRRHGVGHALVSAATGWAVETGTPHVSVDVEPGARGTHRFLARLGLGQLLVVRTAPVLAVRRRLAADAVTALADGGLVPGALPGLSAAAPVSAQRLRTVRGRVTLREAVRGLRDRSDAAGT